MHLFKKESTILIYCHYTIVEDFKGPNIYSHESLKKPFDRSTSTWKKHSCSLKHNINPTQAYPGLEQSRVQAGLWSGLARWSEFKETTNEAEFINNVAIC